MADVNFVCVDPKYQGRGIGLWLCEVFLNHVVAAAGEDATLPVYLESTVEAVPMYERLGFKKEDWFEMKIPAMPKGGGSKGKGAESENKGEGEGEEEMMTYREVTMIYYPKGRGSLQHRVPEGTVIWSQTFV